MANFEKDFEEKKAEFQNLFGFAWNKQPELYLQYLQVWYMAEMIEKPANIFAKLVNQQEEIKQEMKTFKDNQ